MRNNVIDIILFEDTSNGLEEVVYSLPAKNEVCDRCYGYGKHCHPDIDGNGITQDEWADWDYEEKDSYLNGKYDVICHKCHGNKVILEIDDEQCTAEQKIILERWYKQLSEI